jgi:hypothetical protein
MPVGWTDFAVDFKVLERVEHAQRLIDAAPDGQVIDEFMADKSFAVNQEQAAQGHRAVGGQHAVVSGDLFGEIGNEWVVEAAEATQFAGRVDPGKMGVLAVHRNPQHDGVALFELLDLVVKRNDLGRADKGEVERIEIQHDVFFAAISAQVDILELTIDNGSGFEVGCLLLDECAHVVVVCLTDANVEYAGVECKRNDTYLGTMEAQYSLACPGHFKKIALQTWQSARMVHKGCMFSVSQLTTEHKTALVRWASEGATMPDLQRCLKAEFGIGITYMETRMLVLDLGLELHETPKPVEKQPEPASPPVPTGTVSVTMDHLALPGALVSGRVTFSDGETGVWMLDQSGRPGLDPDTAGYRPTPEDISEFQKQLRTLIQKSGL